MKNKVSITFMVCAMLFATCLIIANIVEQKTILVLGVECTAGLFIFPLSYVLGDVITEIWGVKRARLVILLGFAMNLLAVIVFNLSVIAEPSANFEYNREFALILGSTWRISLASFIAFILGSMLNAEVMDRMKKRDENRRFGFRAIVSTVVGEGADSLVFFFIAFYGVIPTDDLWMLIFTQSGIKIVYEIAVLPITTFVVKHMKAVEGV